MSDQSERRPGQIERSETLSALASYFKRWSKEDESLKFLEGEAPKAHVTGTIPINPNDCIDISSPEAT